MSGTQTYPEHFSWVCRVDPTCVFRSPVIHSSLGDLLYLYLSRCFELPSTRIVKHLVQECLLTTQNKLNRVQCTYFESAMQLLILLCAWQTPCPPVGPFATGQLVAAFCLQSYSGKNIQDSFSAASRSRPHELGGLFPCVNLLFSTQSWVRASLVAAIYVWHVRELTRERPYQSCNQGTFLTFS